MQKKAISSQPPSAQLNANHDDLIKGVLACLAGTFLFACQDAITKHLTQSIPIVIIVGVRFLVFTLFAVVFAHQRIGLKKALLPPQLKLQITRSILICVEIAIFAYALKTLGLAEMHTIFACFPLIVTALSIPMLGEKVGWRRWLAVFIGFIGTIIILKPGTGIISSGALLGLLAAFMFSIYNLLTRKAGRSDPFESSLLYFGLAGFFSALIIVPIYWEPVTMNEGLWLGLITLTGIAAHLLFIKALQLVPAAILQPFNYFILVWAIVIGYLAYGEILDTTTILGAIIVVGSGMFITYREFKVRPEKRFSITSR